MMIDSWRTLPNLEEGRRLNGRGNLVLGLGNHQNTERYLFDFDICTTDEGWVQYDTNQDAWYFGMWVQPKAMWTLTFCEGDLTLVQCPARESFKAELADAAECYGDPPPAFKVIDDDGQVTHYYDTRPTGDENGA